MKTIKFISLAFLLLFAWGCELDEVNPSSVPTDQEWRTAAGYEKLVNGCYFDLIRIVYGQAEDTFVVNAEGGTDIWQDTDPTGGNGNWSRLMRYDGDFGGLLGEAYQGFYATVNACNAAIDYATKVQGLSQERIDALVAEAHYLRAHSLYHLVEQYGGKYLSETYTASPVSSLPCSTVNAFYEVILKDLEFAKQHLPVRQEVFGHVTRAAAYHLLARAALTYASYTDALGNAEAVSAEESRRLIETARDAADYLIDHANDLGVRLYDDVREVFDEANNKSNAEALFVVCHSMQQAYNPRGNYYNRVWKHFGAYKNATNGIYLDGMAASYATEVNGVAVPKLAKCNCILEPSKYLIDLYKEKDLRYEAFFSDKYYINKPNTEDGKAYTWTETDAKRYGLDPARVGNPAFDIPLGQLAVYISRKTYTPAERNAARYAICNISDNYADPKQPGYFFPSLKKFDTPSLYAGTNASKPYSGADCIIFRLGETYLLSAEAHWRLGSTDKAKERLNVLRNRACEGHDHSMDIAAADVTEEFLLDEYARELCGEWNRWFTLKRFRAIESRLAKCSPQVTKFNPDIHYVRPIPSWMLTSIDNGEEYQNPGY